MSADVDQTAICEVCSRFIELRVSDPRPDGQPPVWRHMTGMFDHPAGAQPGSEKETPQ